MRAHRVALAIVFAVLTPLGAIGAAETTPTSDPTVAPSFDSADDESQGEEDLLEEGGGRDPFEGFNRDVFSFNRSMDRWLFDPVTRGYQHAVPVAGRHAFYRFFQNLDSPVILANHMLQFRVVDAASTLTRCVINSTIGVAGLFDPAASYFEVYRVEGDFGQTLARYGTPSGPYLMLPVFGPSTVRDVFGDAIDILADPISYMLGPWRWWTIVLGGGEGLTTREAHLDDYHELEAGSIDFYSALRSAYLQSRDAMVREARGQAAEAGILTADIEKGEKGDRPLFAP
jgi:phospholipid-binding lipoprotein MlaA